MRICPTPPVKCSGCFSTKRDQPHVDFESAWDGPLIDPERPRSGHIDWLVLCQDCLARAHALLPEQRDRHAALKAENAQLRAQVEEAENYASKVEDALSYRPPTRPRKPGPKPAKASA